MKIIDKNQVNMIKQQPMSAQEQAQEQAQKKKTIRKILFDIVFFVLLGIGIYVIDHWPGLSGEPYPLRLENVTVIPGETTVQELASAGYELADRASGEWVMENYSGDFYFSETIDLSAKVVSHYYHSLCLVKDGRLYGHITIYNEDGWSSKPLAECKVALLEVSAVDHGSEQAAILDIPLLETTKEAVSEKLGAEPEILGSGRCVWKKGRYSMSYDPDTDDTSKKISSGYELGSKYHFQSDNSFQ